MYQVGTYFTFNEELAALPLDVVEFCQVTVFVEDA
jgi:hypothetical protein